MSDFVNLDVYIANALQTANVLDQTCRTPSTGDLRQYSLLKTQLDCVKQDIELHKNVWGGWGGGGGNQK